MNLGKLTKKELMNLAAKKKVSGRSSMTKEQLIAALEPLYSKSTVSPKGRKSKAKETENLSSDTFVGYDSTPKTEVKHIKKDEYPIPTHYNKDTLVLMPVDPSKEYIYWEISDVTLNKFKSELRLSETRLLLKVFSQYNNVVTETASVSVERMGNWYFNIYAPDTLIWSELGIIDSNGAFHKILKSRVLKMPADKVSDVVDNETWLTLGGDLDKLYQLSGLGMHDSLNSRDIQKKLAKQIAQHMGSSNRSSSGK